MGNFRKPSKNRQYVNKPSAEKPEPDFTVAENEQAARVAASTASEDLSGQEDELSDAEYLRRYRTSLSNTVLPAAPKMAGFHLCWVPLASNNRFDTVDMRKQLGYVVVKPEEVPEFVSPSNRGAQFDGCVSHNELILMKIPLRLYNLHMKDSHHVQPNEQERIIKDDIANKMVDKEGNSIVKDGAEMTGMNRLARKVAEPTFA